MQPMVRPFIMDNRRTRQIPTVCNPVIRLARFRERHRSCRATLRWRSRFTGHAPRMRHTLPPRRTRHRPGLLPRRMDIRRRPAMLRLRTAIRRRHQAIRPPILRLWPPRQMALRRLLIRHRRPMRVLRPPPIPPLVLIRQSRRIRDRRSYPMPHRVHPPQTVLMFRRPGRRTGLDSRSFRLTARTNARIVIARAASRVASKTPVYH